MTDKGEKALKIWLTIITIIFVCCCIVYAISVVIETQDEKAYYRNRADRLTGHDELRRDAHIGRR